jgi:hypothetical protein
MKKHFTLFASLLLTLSAQANWEYERVSENKSIQFSAYNFDDNYDNSVSLSCTHDLDKTILAIMPKDKMSSRQNNILSFTFNDQEKIKLTANYARTSAYISDYSHNVNSEEHDKFSAVIAGFKKFKQVKVGYVNQQGKSRFFTIALKGSSKAINQLLKHCSI